LSVRSQNGLAKSGHPQTPLVSGPSPNASNAHAYRLYVFKEQPLSR
jgi:hypothetical protein